MSINDLDLDINNYNMRDLENFFQLSSNKIYTAPDIDEKEYAMRTLLLSSGEVDKKQQKDLIDFLSLARDWLIHVKCKSVNTPEPSIPSSIDSNLIVDQKPNSRLTDLIDRPETVFIQAQTEEDAFPGKINPLNKRIITQCLNIDTKFRENYLNTKSSDFHIDLPARFSKVISMQLTSLELPLSFYGISKQFENNYFYIKITYAENFINISDENFDINTYDGNLITTEQIFDIPDGNYTSSEFVAIINLIVGGTAVVLDVNDITIFNYILFTLGLTDTGSGTGKVTVAPNGLHSNKIKFIEFDFTRNKAGECDKYVPYNYRIGRNLGFIKPTYSGSNTYTADTVIEPNTIRYLYLVIDDFNNNVSNNFVGTFNRSIHSSNILARISIQGSFFSLLMNDQYNNISLPRKYFGPVDIQRLHIQLTDDNGRIIDLNNADFSFCLNLRVLYDL